ncbi:PepSY domain-containing protein [Pseudoalteromonas sp. SCSIO 43201]|uniref:PepSY-associated TM helix domain-containing protein n=1 Tax=Pseudoalteromonas TaxID=53246 RepID=UPI0020758010|nr:MULTISPECIES: PepSY-associated TM helix domain-containing protein [Pseudoalteromonas]MDW7549025.1 PepSY-associated TM helix domain-containing protein [Pseudoalteromonas peptidolytica]USD30276.1 PepSY domain-containing protein [Pseudoalteromonas sp. SCSIO 43201]
MRKTLFKWHSLMALIAMLPLLIISLTGSMLVFKFEIDSILLKDQATLNYVGQDIQRKPMKELVNLVADAHPNYEIGSWELFDDGYEADRVYLLKHGTDTWFKTYLDPYQGEMLSTPVGIHSDFTDFILHLHYTLLLNDSNRYFPNMGVAIGLFIAILFTFLGASGLIIYRRFWRRFFSFRRHTPRVILFSELHKLIGIWSAPVLLCLGITGVYFNAVDYYHEAFEHDEADHHIVSQAMFNRTLDFDAMMAQSLDAIGGFTPTYWLFPFEPQQKHITIFGSVADTNPFISNYASTVSFDATTGAQIAVYDIRTATSLERIIDSFRKLHFGHFAGLPSKIIWSLMGLAPILLGFSGVYLWWQRKRKKHQSRRLRNANLLN